MTVLAGIRSVWLQCIRRWWHRCHRCFSTWSAWHAFGEFCTTAQRVVTRAHWLSWLARGRIQTTRVRLRCPPPMWSYDLRTKLGCHHVTPTEPFQASFGRSLNSSLGVEHRNTWKRALSESSDDDFPTSRYARDKLCQQISVVLEVPGGYASYSNQ